MDAAYRKKIENFLNLKKIAVVGLSGTKDNPGNFIYERFKKNNYDVYAVNPAHNSINNNPCYASLASIPENFEGVVICTSSIITLDIIKECIELNIKYIWMHQSFGNGSHNHEAKKLCFDNDINCIPYGCPLMFLKVDPAHWCMKWIMHFQGKFKTE